MNLLSSKRNSKVIYKATKYIETTDDIINPYRGWYQIHTFRLHELITMEDREYTLNNTDTLALLLIDIGEYRDKPLDEIAISNLDNIFSFFRDYRLDMIVRVVYDIEGKCLEKEPSTEEQVIEHLHQLVPIMKKYTANIFVYQGLLIGNWGEMHSSKFLSPARLRKLADGFLHNVDFTYLAVRRPAYIRILFPEGEDVRQTKVGIFDDAILASPTHLGTFGEKSSHEVRREQSWLPKEEIDYVSSLCDRVPYGGEALYTDEKDEITGIRNSLKEMDTYFSKLHITYLNRIHDANFIEHLKSLSWTGGGIYKGMNGFQYMSRHLGYRFVFRNSKVQLLETDESVLKWEFEIENVGFSRCFFNNSCRLKALDEYGSDITLDISDWVSLNQIASREKRSFVCMTPIVKGNVYLSFSKEDTGCAIYFANKNKIENGIKSDIYIGTIESIRK